MAWSVVKEVYSLLRELACAANHTVSGVACHRLPRCGRAALQYRFYRAVI